LKINAGTCIASLSLFPLPQLPSDTPLTEQMVMDHMCATDMEVFFFLAFVSFSFHSIVSSFYYLFFTFIVSSIFSIYSTVFLNAKQSHLRHGYFFTVGLAMLTLVFGNQKKNIVFGILKASYFSI
jgi:hypothetical protein